MAQDIDLWWSGQKLIGDYGLVNEHDGDVIADGIDAAAADAFEPGGVGGESYLRFAGGADQDFEQVGAEGHEWSILAGGVEEP